MNIALGNINSIYLDAFVISLIIFYLQMILGSMLISNLSPCKTVKRFKPISGDSFSNKLHLVCFPQEFPKINKWIRFLSGISILLPRSTPQVANWQRERLSGKPSARRGLPRLLACLNKRNTRAGRILIPRFHLNWLMPDLRPTNTENRYRRDAMTGANISALSLFLECDKIRFNKEPKGRWRLI